jgi:hypothetical protein
VLPGCATVLNGPDGSGHAAIWLLTDDFRRGISPTLFDRRAVDQLRFSLAAGMSFRNHQ